MVLQVFLLQVLYFGFGFQILHFAFGSVQDDREEAPFRMTVSLRLW